MKYTLINCYSDHNNGDLGIILSTLDLIRSVDKRADIVCMSTYNQSDPAFTQEHGQLRKYSEIIGAVFGELNILSLKSGGFKLLRLAFDLMRLTFMLAVPRQILFLPRLLFSLNEKKSIDRLLDSDYIVSKGGSFLCDDLDLRSKIALFRFLFLFLLVIRFKKKLLIVGQSIGPVYAWYNRIIVNIVLKKSRSIVLRENRCVSEYPYLIFPKNTIKINDIAFFSNHRTRDMSWIELGPQINVGVTIKSVNPRDSNNYKQMFKEVIEFLVNEKNARVHIFPHVTIDNDVEESVGIYLSISDSVKHNVHVYSGNFTESDLRVLYSKMDYFVGTRLHSTIFAIGEGVPSICITYHGTKAVGVFENFGLQDFVVSNYESVDVIKKFNILVANRNEVKSQIAHQIEKDRFLYREWLGDLLV